MSESVSSSDLAALIERARAGVPTTIEFEWLANVAEELLRWRSTQDVGMFSQLQQTREALDVTLRILGEAWQELTYEGGGLLPGSKERLNRVGIDTSGPWPKVRFGDSPPLPAPAGSSGCSGSSSSRSSSPR